MTIEDPGLNLGWRTPSNSTRREPERDREHVLLSMLESHGRREGSLLESYRQVAERSDAGEGVQYLVRLILEDERRHHRVFEEMANELRSFLWELDVEPSVPAMRSRKDPELLAQTKRLLEFEREDAKELKQLRKTVRDSPKSSLDPLLIEMMMHDTAKHIAILEFICDRLDR